MRPLALAASCVLLAGCGGLSAADRAGWAPGPPRRDAIPILAYRGDVDLQSFERHMALLEHAGYDTIGLEPLLRHLRGEPVALPPRPFVLTFDGGLESVRDADQLLHRYDYRAALFVDVGRVAAGDRRYLAWDDLSRLARWDVQVQSGSGNHVMQWGPGRGDVGSFYAYRGADEVLGGWRERVFGDFSWAERQLARRVDGYRPLAVAPPGGNYGQTGTNDPEIPRLLLGRLQRSFPLVLTFDRPALALRGAGTEHPLGRLDMTAGGAERRLVELVRRR